MDVDIDFNITDKPMRFDFRRITKEKFITLSVKTDGHGNFIVYYDGNKVFDER